GNKTKTIFKSKMHKGQGYNQLILDDTTEQVGTRLHSTPGETQLNMGFLVHPRNTDGNGKERGHGFELRTDDWGAVRAGKGLYLSTDARKNAEGNQLDLQEAIQQLENALTLAKSLAKTAGHTGEAIPADITDQEKQLASAYTDLTKSALLVSAADGMAIVTPKSAQISAQQNLTFTAMQNTDISTNSDVRVAAKKAISLFSE